MLIYEYYNAELLQNTALKIAETVGLLTPPAGQAFGVLSALTNLETVSSTLIENYSAVRVHTLGVSVPTEEAVQAYIQDIIEHDVPSIDKIIIKSATIPTASAELLGSVYQYVGQTDGTYQHGYIYECVAETETETLIMFDPVGTGKLGFDYQNHSVYELFDRIAALTTPTFDPQDVVSGSFRLDKVNELWYISGYDANGNALFTDFTVEATGGEYCLDGYGYIYTFPFPDDYEDGHTENFTIVQDQQSVYSWERIDVQPNSEAEIAELQAEVAEIQSVIPAQASASNQLADKAYVQTGLDSKQDNLTATDGLTLNNNIISGKTLQDDIADINALIPNQATAQNQLADKAFVNSSIETNTAIFRGTYNTLVELEAQPADNNDYGFVVSTDAAGNTVYNRYKYNGTAWVFEYALNNSSFTASQWAAINSNATDTKIAQIDTNKNTINNHIANVSNPHQVTKAQVGLGNADNTSDLNKPISTATQAALDTKAPLDTFLAPNFDGLTPIATYEFDTSSTSFYKLLTFNNIYATTEDIPVAYALFRITATIGGKTSIINAIVETQKALTYMRVLSNHTTGYTASSNTGVRYMRTAIPKALNDGHDWELDISGYNATARHIKVEVFQSDNGFTWFANGSVSTVTTSTHTSINITYYTTQGTIIHPTLNASVTSASSATYISGRLPKILPGTMPLTGAALLANQFCFMSNSLVYPASDNTVPINTGFGLALSYGAVASGAATTYYQILQKYAVSSLSNIPHDTLERGDPCYFRCTMDANGNIFSDNYVATEMTPGYTWYYVGVASSATAIMVDTTSSVFLTLDANGKLTHVNGTKCNAEWGNIAGTITDQTDLQTALDAKQDVITDLATIRAGAALGATALQAGDNVSELVNDAGYLTQHQTLADLGITATASEINVLDGITASTAELNYTDGVTSNIQTQLNGKQATISDLATIRSGAALGATAVQPGDLATVATTGDYDDLLNKPTIPTVNDATLTIQKNGTSVATFTANASSGVTANITVPTTTNDLTNNSGFITSSDIPVTDVTVGGTSVVSSGVAAVPAIPTVNDATITITQGGVAKGSFTLNQTTSETIALDAGGGGGGSVDIDNLTITENASDEIQAVAVIDQNTGIAKTWTGTMAEYEAIVTKDPETEYIITDDIGGPATVIAELAEAVNDKVDKGHQVIEFQEPTSANNYTWYRKYADGWVEQGGIVSVSQSANTSVTLPVEMANTDFYVNANSTSETDGEAVSRTTAIISTTNIYIRIGYSSNLTRTCCWQVSGMAA